MDEYRTPGVYIGSSHGNPPVNPVPTSLPVFIGLPEKAPADRGDQAVSVRDWDDYVRQFGGFAWNRFLACAVYQYFQAGGQRCYVLPAGAVDDQQPAAAEVIASPLRFKAASAGTWADGWVVQVTGEPARGDDAAMIRLLRPSAPAGQSAPAQQRLDSFIARNKLPSVTVNGASFTALEEWAVADLAKPTDWMERINQQSFFLRVADANSEPDGSLQPGSYTLTGGRDGDWVFAGESMTQAVNAIPEICLLAVPDNVLKDVSAQQQVMDQWLTEAAKESRFFVAMDGPSNLDVNQVIQFKQGVDENLRESASYGALYYPWLWFMLPTNARQTLVPPSGACLGRYAYTDEKTGVWAAPAGLDYGALDKITGLNRNLSESELGLLNSNSVNPLLNKPDAGDYIWGARTLDGNSYDWRYIQIRRTIIYIEQSLKLALSWTAFETHGPTLWSHVTSQVSGFLTGLWQDGALFGTSAKQAYFVICDASNNSQDAMDTGELFVDIGVALQQPAEFIRLRISQTLSKT